MPLSKAHWEVISHAFSSVLIQVSWSFAKAKKFVSSAKPIVILPIRGSRALYKGARKRMNKMGDNGDPWGTPEGTEKGAVSPSKRSSARRSHK